jgi:peptide/nickel transport system permease protein
MRGRLELAFRIARARPRFAAGYLIVAAVVLLAVLAPLVAPYDPIVTDSASFLEPPSWRHLFGTDAVGMDIFSRTIFAPRIDLTIAVTATLLSASVGTLIGAYVGFYSHERGLHAGLGYGIMRAADVLQAFPVFVFAVALVASLGQSLQTVIIAIAFVNTPIYLRLMRAQVMAIRSMRYVEAAQVAGLSDWATIRRHVIPNSMGPVLAQMTINIGWSVLITAALSFIGAGVRPPTPEWGSMIAMGFQNMVTGEWWPSLFPGLALSITVFGFSLVGSSIEVLTDPAKRRALIAEIRPPRDRAGLSSTANA